MENKNEVISATASRELTIARVINAPRELVFKVWTDPDHIGAWWGPNGFNTTTSSMELKAGGIWLFTMHGPDGTAYPNRVIFKKVVRPELLEYVHDSGEDGDPDRFEVIVTFEDQGKKTKLTLYSTFASAEALETARKFGAEEGGRQTLQRLDEYIAGMVS